MTLAGVLKSGRQRPYGYVLDIDVPPIKTLPSAPDASVTFFDATVRDLTVGRRGRRIHYIDSPVLCDGTYFLLDGAFSYQGGRRIDVLERFTLAAAALPIADGPPPRVGQFSSTARSRHLRHPQQPPGARGGARRRRAAATPTRSGASATSSATAPTRMPAPRSSARSSSGAWRATTTWWCRGDIDIGYFAMSAGAAARWTVKVIDTATREYLGRLAPARREGRASASTTRARATRSGSTCSRSRQAADCLRHSASGSPDRPLARRVLLQPQRRRRSTASQARRRRRPRDAEGEWLVNPGSVGQPRDGDPRAAWLMLDTDHGRRVPARRLSGRRGREGDRRRRPPAPARGPPLLGSQCARRRHARCDTGTMPRVRAVRGGVRGAARGGAALAGCLSLPAVSDSGRRPAPPRGGERPARDPDAGGAGRGRRGLHRRRSRRRHPSSEIDSSSRVNRRPAPSAGRAAPRGSRRW